MRARIIFSVKNKGAFVPYYHQFLLAQTAKAVLLAGGNDDFLNYPYYHFSGLKGQTKISRQGLHYLSSKVTLVIASPNKEFIDYFLRSLFNHEEISVGNLLLAPLAVEKEAMPDFSDEMKFICISPLVLLKPTLFDNSGKKFIDPETDEFSDLLYESTLQRMDEYGFEQDQIANFYKFQIVPDTGYLEKIRNANKKFARIYPIYDQDVKYEVRGYTFPFTLYAAREVQEFVFTCGLGSFTHKGFGMLDLANVDPTARTEAYNFHESVYS